jgi:hypothetical protein
VNVSDEWTINELWNARNGHIKGISRSTAGSGGVTFISTTRGVLVMTTYLSSSFPSAFPLHMYYAMLFMPV